MEQKIKEIVKKIYNIENVNRNGFRYKLVKSLREKCEGNQEGKRLLEELVEHLMCLAVMKKRENFYKYKTYKQLCFILTNVFEDVGLPINVEDLFNFGRQDQNTINNIILQLGRWNVSSSFIPYCWRMCKLRCFNGIGKKSVMNVFYFYIHGTLPEINNNFGPEYPHSLSPPRSDNNQIRDSRKDILIRQLQSSVEMLSIENRSLRGSEENIECTICLESEGTLVPTTCGHKFHTNCLIEWLSTHDTCPVCRHDLVST